MGELCTWTEDDDGNWHTACGRLWVFFEDGPVENRVKFCIECGQRVVAVNYVEPKDEDDDRESQEAPHTPQEAK